MFKKRECILKETEGVSGDMVSRETFLLLKINTKAGLCSSCCVVSGLCCRKIMTHIRERIWAHLKICINWTFSSVQFSHSVMSNSLQAHELQHTRPPCPSPTPGVHSNSCPSSCPSSHLIVCRPLLLLLPVPHSIRVFPMSRLFESSGQSIGASAPDPNNLSSIAQSCPTLWYPHEMQHTRLPCPSPTPGAYSDSYPLSQWCHPTILSSVVPFSSSPQSFPAWGSFQISQLCVSSGQSIGVSASTSVLPVNIQDWFPLGWTAWCLDFKKFRLVPQKC